MPAPAANGRPTDYARREIVNGILYGTRTGCAWRLLPHDFPPWRIGSPGPRGGQLLSGAGIRCPFQQVAVTLADLLECEPAAGRSVARYKVGPWP